MYIYISIYIYKYIYIYIYIYQCRKIYRKTKHSFKISNFLILMNL